MTEQIINHERRISRIEAKIDEIADELKYIRERVDYLYNRSHSNVVMDTLVKYVIFPLVLALAGVDIAKLFIGHP